MALPGWQLGPARLGGPVRLCAAVVVVSERNGTRLCRAREGRAEELNPEATVRVRRRCDRSDFVCRAVRGAQPMGSESFRWRD